MGSGNSLHLNEPIPVAAYSFSTFIIAGSRGNREPVVGGQTCREPVAGSRGRFGGRTPGAKHAESRAPGAGGTGGQTYLFQNLLYRDCSVQSLGVGYSLRLNEPLDPWMGAECVVRLHSFSDVTFYAP